MVYFLVVYSRFAPIQVAFNTFRSFILNALLKQKTIFTVKKIGVWFSS